MNTLAKAKHLNELVKLNSGTNRANEHFNDLLEKGEDHAFGAMKHAYWVSCKISNVRPMKIEWMQDFYAEMEEQEELESKFGL